MAYVHDFDPFALQFTWQPLVNLFGSDFGIRWYGLAYLSGFLCTYFVVHWMAKRRLVDIKPENVGDFITVAAIGTMVGGRLGYCLFYAPDLLTSFSSSFPFWGVLEVHKGGMSSHGGILGVIAACFWYGKRQRISKLQLVDFAGLMGGAGIFFGRLANYINGELFGRVCDEGYIWAVKFPSEVYHWAGYEVQKLKSLSSVLGSLSTYKNLPANLTKENWEAWVDRYQYAGPARSNIQSVLSQIQIAVQEGNESVKEALSHVLNPRYPSQIYQALMEGLLVFVISFLFWKKPRKPGFITGVFGVSYSLMRILGEQYRMPDAHIGYQLFGLTRGQWLSFGLLGLGLVILLVAVKSTSKTCGGWGKR